MTTTLDALNAKKKPDPTAEAAAKGELVRMAKEKGWSLTGPDGAPAASAGRCGGNPH